MSRGFGVKLAVVALLCLSVVVTVAAKEPMFVRWLIADDPGDQTIRTYWERAEKGKLDPEGLVDLGTMLFQRGYPRDAVRYFRRALKEDSKLYEAWFRIGLVEHREGRLRNARHAYAQCLDLLTGHGWCNFYMGLLEEQTGHPARALDYYRRAFKFAPELADPEVNPELLYSQLDLGAVIRHVERERFSREMPMPFLQPDAVSTVRATFEPEPDLKLKEPGGPPPPPLPQAEETRPDKPAGKVEVFKEAPGDATKPATGAGGPAGRQRMTPASRRGPRAEPTVQPVPTPEPEPTPVPGSVPQFTSVSPEASLMPWWPSFQGQT